MIHGTHNAIENDKNNNVKIFINGAFYHREDAKISVFDSGYLVGDGVWEGFRVHSGRLLFIDEHFNRLWQGAKAIGLKINFSKKQLLENILKTLEVNEMNDGIHVRVMLTRGIKKTPSQDPRLTIGPPNLVIIAEHKIACSESKSKGITLFTSTIRRGSPDYLDPKLNCHSKLHEVQALVQAIEAGADEALMLDVNGFVSTCNATNFFMVKNGEVWTSTGDYCMNGITRQNIINICKANEISCHEKNFSLTDVYDADEAFVTGSFGGVTPVKKIDGRAIGELKTGPITLNLNHLYQELINRLATKV